ncbi:hypothetical protein PENTCL1PPCAC_20863, partial [Pristionchus entomophagus]
SPKLYVTGELKEIVAENQELPKSKWYYARCYTENCWNEATFFYSIDIWAKRPLRARCVTNAAKQ